MASRSNTGATLRVLTVFLVSLALIFAAILPLGPGYGRLPGPDLLLVVFLLWSIRRPEMVPVGIVALIFLLADLILMRPPGLMAATVVLATEYIKTRKDLTLEVPFVVEWGFAAVMIIMVTFFTTLVMMIFGSHVPPLGPLLIKLVFTIFAYPIIVVVAHYLFGLDRPTRNDDRGFRGRA